MNKYQEALESLHRSAKFLLGNQVNKEKQILQELVDKATPMKPVVLTKTICCSKCDTILGDNNLWTQTIVSFCPDCGQAIDWSE